MGRKAVQKTEVTAEGDAAKDAADAVFVGKSPETLRLKALARRVASRPSTVLILGETGTGKAMLARYIHACSPRAGGPFVPVDCTAFSEAHFESQMFGHVRGAFPGATRDVVGLIRGANRGTLFLDEIADLNLELQAKLLRVLQERHVTPMGDTRPREVDLRVICASQPDLPDRVRAGKFNPDLYFRLQVLTLTVLPLRDRRQDIAPLARHFLERLAVTGGAAPKRVTRAAVEALESHGWPGNVRELAGMIERTYAGVGDAKRIDAPDLVWSEAGKSGKRTSGPAAPRRLKSIPKPKRRQ